MIGISRLLCGVAADGDRLRYGDRRHGDRRHGTALTADRRPVVVWNCTRACNLRCVHCYSDCSGPPDPDEMTTDDGRRMLQDLAAFGVPVILFSGGEPLARGDLFDLAAEARDLGLRATLSTNGTLITAEVARRLRDVGFSYVGISLDGIGAVNDRFRGRDGAFDAAVRGFRHCAEVGQKVGLRMTLTRHNARDLHAVFDFIERESIPRACFYHLVYSGRGGGLRDYDLSWAASRAALDVIAERTEDLHRRGRPVEILTVDNHADGPYLYLRLRDRDPDRAEQVRRLLEYNGGGRWSSGVGIGAVDWRGEVHPDQFWSDYSLGNVRRRPFSEIWTDIGDSLLAGLKDRLPRLRGRCRVCRWQAMCGGALRVRAQRVYDDPWGPDPGCYLTDEEIGLDDDARCELERRGETYPPPAWLADPSDPAIRPRGADAAPA